MTPENPAQSALFTADFSESADTRPPHRDRVDRIAAGNHPPLPCTPQPDSWQKHTRTRASFCPHISALNCLRPCRPGSRPLRGKAGYRPPVSGIRGPLPATRASLKLQPTTPLHPHHKRFFRHQVFRHQGSTSRARASLKLQPTPSLRPKPLKKPRHLRRPQLQPVAGHHVESGPTPKPSSLRSKNKNPRAARGRAKGAGGSCPGWKAFVLSRSWRFKMTAGTPVGEPPLPLLPPVKWSCGKASLPQFLTTEARGHDDPRPVRRDHVRPRHRLAEARVAPRFLHRVRIHAGEPARGRRVGGYFGVLGSAFGVRRWLCRMTVGRSDRRTVGPSDCRTVGPSHAPSRRGG